ncbi:cytochrome b-c1 complex subunit 10 [Lipomyces arxii]|uniref:cytochrome b-c1 complex subunit 10 n=1 Tax=Lipomyces arxii TaxID=56418 RepID=UPI0034CE6166
MSLRIAFKSSPRLAGFTLGTFMKWVPVLGLWGGAAGAGVIFFLEPIPRVQDQILSKVPVVGKYWIKNIDPNDVPF